MRVRYVRPVRLHSPVEVRARIVAQDGDLVTLKVNLEQAGKLGCSARISFTLPDREGVERTLDQPLDPDQICRSLRALEAEYQADLQKSSKKMKLHLRIKSRKKIV